MLVEWQSWDTLFHWAAEPLLCHWITYPRREPVSSEPTCQSQDRNTVSFVEEETLIAAGAAISERGIGNTDMPWHTHIAYVVMIVITAIVANVNFSSLSMSVLTCVSEAQRGRRGAPCWRDDCEIELLHFHWYLKVHQGDVDWTGQAPPLAMLPVRQFIAHGCERLWFHGLQSRGNRGVITY